MKKLIFTTCLLVSLSQLEAQTPDNTSPGGTSSTNNNAIQPPAVSPGTVLSNPPAIGVDRNPTGTSGTDMTNPNNNGFYETNPNAIPKNNSQSTPNTVTPHYHKTTIVYWHSPKQKHPAGEPGGVNLLNYYEKLLKQSYSRDSSFKIES